MLRSLNRRVLELEANVNDLTEVQQRMSSDEDAVSSEARKRLMEQMERAQKLESALQKTQQQVEDLETKLQASHHNFARKSASVLLFTWSLTASLPAVPNCCCSKGSAPYWSNPPFLIFDIRAL